MINLGTEYTKQLTYLVEVWNRQPPGQFTCIAVDGHEIDDVIDYLLCTVEQHIPPHQMQITILPTTCTIHTQSNLPFVPDLSHGTDFKTDWPSTHQPLLLVPVDPCPPQYNTTHRSHMQLCCLLLPTTCVLAFQASRENSLRGLRGTVLLLNVSPPTHSINHSRKLVCCTTVLRTVLHVQYLSFLFFESGGVGGLFLGCILNPGRNKVSSLNLACAVGRKEGRKNK